MNASVKRTRPRGFASWTPRAKNSALVQDVQAVLVEYREHLPLTCRQIFYRLVATKGFDKTERAYSRLCETIGRARRARLIPFAAIRDDGSARYESQSWQDVQDFLDDVRHDAQGFRLDRQQGQKVRLWVLCEAGGMAPMLARVANPLGVAVLTSGGFDSLTVKHKLAQEMAAEFGRDGQVEVLHLGDLDPSGVHIFSSLSQDVTKMVVEIAGAEPKFTRLAVTPDQAERLALPTAPPKATDRRRLKGDTVQCEAIAPNILADILRDAIEARRNAEIAEFVLLQEAKFRAAILAMLENAA